MRTSLITVAITARGPKCGGADAQAWLDGQCERLLPVPYFLVTFTLPEQLRVACRSHQRLFYEILFDESAATLKEMASIPRRLGGELGFLGILHTWTRQLAYHPHVHYIVPGGGLRPDGGKWRKCRVTKKGEPYLLPVELLSHHFRHRFKETAPSSSPRNLRYHRFSALARRLGRPQPECGSRA